MKRLSWFQKEDKPCTLGRYSDPFGAKRIIKNGTKEDIEAVLGNLDSNYKYLKNLYGKECWDLLKRKKQEAYRLLKKKMT